MVHYSEICEGCIYNDGEEMEVCDGCKGEGIFIGGVIGEGVSKLSTMERLALLLSAQNQEEEELN